MEVSARKNDVQSAFKTKVLEPLPPDTLDFRDPFFGRGALEIFAVERFALFEGRDTNHSLDAHKPSVHGSSVSVHSVGLPDRTHEKAGAAFANAGLVGEMPCGRAQSFTSPRAKIDAT